MPEAISHQIKIDYDDRGQGEPALLFLPGWCGSRQVFEGLAACCARWRRTLALDWRGHGQSERTADDFTADDLVADALAVIENSGADTVIPVTLSHAGWIALELRRRLGAHIPKLIWLDWIVTDAPPPFLEALEGLQDPVRWRQTRDQLFAMWLHDVNLPPLTQYVREDMGSYPFAMWARAGREIAAAYRSAGSPFQALATLDTAVPVLHLYAQPQEPGYLAMQQAFGAAHKGFQVARMDAHSHFPMYEAPEAMAAAIEQFVADLKD
jgi:pimeloyl-ACP methyl ester carboxylesterase